MMFRASLAETNAFLRSLGLMVDKCKVMVVDDEALVAWDLAYQLEDYGVAIEGPYHCLNSALEASASALPDAAVLDINLQGTQVWPLAEHLYQNGCPILFISADADRERIRNDFPKARLLDKPVSPEQLAPFVQSL